MQPVGEDKAIITQVYTCYASDHGGHAACSMVYGRLVVGFSLAGCKYALRVVQADHINSYQLPLLLWYSVLRSPGGRQRLGDLSLRLELEISDQCRYPVYRC